MSISTSENIVGGRQAIMAANEASGFRSGKHLTELKRFLSGNHNERANEERLMLQSMEASEREQEKNKSR